MTAGVGIAETIPQLEQTALFGSKHGQFQPWTARINPWWVLARYLLRGDACKTIARHM